MNMEIIKTCSIRTCVEHFVEASKDIDSLSQYITKYLIFLESQYDYKLKLETQKEITVKPIFKLKKPLLKSVSKENSQVLPFSIKNSCIIKFDEYVFFVPSFEVKCHICSCNNVYINTDNLTCLYHKDSIVNYKTVQMIKNELYKKYTL